MDKRKAQKIAKLLEFEQNLKANPGVAILQTIERELSPVLEVKEELEQAVEQIVNLHNDLETKIDNKVSSIPHIPGARGFKGEDGKDYVLTPKDKEEIASKITVPVVEKVVERTEVIKEIPIVTENVVEKITEDIKGEEIVKRINELPLEENKKIDASHIKNLPKMGGSYPVGVSEAVVKKLIAENGSGGGVSVHNDLTGLNDGDYKHLTAQEKSDLDDLLYPYVAPAITLTSTPATGVREFGNTSASVGLTATTTKNTEDITRVRFYRGSTMIHEVPTPNASGGVETHTDNTELAVSTTYTARVYDGTQEVTSNSRAYNFVYPYLYGVDAPAKPASEMYADFTKSITASGTKTFSFSPTSQVYYFCYPASYGALSSIKDPNNFETISDWTLRTENITGLDGNAVSYNIWEFNNITTQTAYNYTFTL
jgi:hypothetical protein